MTKIEQENRIFEFVFFFNSTGPIYRSLLPDNDFFMTHYIGSL